MQYIHTHTHTENATYKQNVERTHARTSTSRRVTYLQNAGDTSVQGVAVEIAVRTATLAVVLALFTASAACSTCSSENITLLSPVPAPTLASSICDETVEVSDVMTVYRCNLWELVPECQIIDSTLLSMV